MEDRAWKITEHSLILNHTGDNGVGVEGATETGFEKFLDSHCQWIYSLLVDLLLNCTLVVKLEISPGVQDSLLLDPRLRGRFSIIIILNEKLC